MDFWPALLAAAAIVQLGCAARSQPRDDVSPSAGVVDAVCLPTFIQDGRPSRTGTAFLLSAPLYTPRPLLITAQHLFGLARPGYPGMKWSETPQHIAGVACRTLAGQATVKAGRPLAVVGAHAISGLADLKDIAIFPTEAGPGGPTPLRLSPDPPKLGDPVWLIAQTAHEPGGPFLHRARVARTTGYLAYVYDEPNLNLGNTSGGPVIDAAGRVVGVNVGVATLPQTHQQIGVADTLSTIGDALSNAKQP